MTIKDCTGVQIEVNFGPPSFVVRNSLGLACCLRNKMSVYW